MFTIQSLVTTVRMTYQGVFLMGAFYAAFEIQPRLQPKAGKTLGYQPSARGATLEVRYVLVVVYGMFCLISATQESNVYLSW